MSVSSQTGPSGDEYYQDYMMVLEVFDKMDPAEQAAQNTTVSSSIDTQQPHNEAQCSTLNGPFDGGGGFLRMACILGACQACQDFRGLKI